MNTPNYRDLIALQRTFFASGRTRDLSFRRERLQALRRMVAANEGPIYQALQQDLRKPEFECYGGETGSVLTETDHALKYLRSWARPGKVRTPLAHFPARCRVHAEPYGVALIMGPWNFPFQLMLNPLVAALAAGNCAVLKPSPVAPASARLIASMIADTFAPEHVSVVEGGTESAAALLKEQFDFLFFTGGPAAGRAVMHAAADRLIPVALELGGKNPCVVDADIDLDVAARRIVWGKFFNAGQSCVAVDYLLVDRRIKGPLLDCMRRTITAFYGSDPAASPDYGRIVNAAHAERLSRLLGRGSIVAGGTVDIAGRYMAPTIIDGAAEDDPVMQEEIFGPILPVIAFDDASEATALMNRLPKPLALYVFSRNKAFQERVLRETSSGGGCINDTVVHQTIADLPFGGVGPSGSGKYHGKAGFELFSNMRSIVARGFGLDIRLRYPPYKDRVGLVKKIL